MITKPMLAGRAEDLTKLESRYPLWVTPKLDGIRCLVIDGHAVTRMFKPVPNKHIREQIERYCPDGFDGEIMSDDLGFNALQSLVMSREGTPDFQYYVFDYVKDDLNKPYLERMKDLTAKVKTLNADFVVPITPEECYNEKQLLEIHQGYVDEGYKGLMLRRGLGPYKCGRSTVNETFLLKLKKFDDSECKVVGIEQLLHNNNKAEKDELGHTKRSHKKEGLIPVDKLGAFNVQDVYTNVEFKVSTGMVDAERKEYWEKGPALVGKIIKYKYQGVGPNKKPRFPVFLGFRDERDMS